MAKKKVVEQAKKALAKKKVAKKDAAVKEVNTAIAENPILTRAIMNNGDQINLINDRIDRLVAALATAKPIKKNM
jgi:hypothetical protein